MRAENHTPEREPLDAAGLRRAAVAPDGLWREIEVVPSTGSTNADLLARALGGEPEGVVLAAEEQTAGRGRMGRTWISPPYAALTFSLLLRPGGAARPARLAPAAHRRGRRRGGHRGDRRRNQAEVAQRRPGRRGQARGHPGRGGRRRGRRRHRPQRVHRTSRATLAPGPGALPATSLRAAGATALNREKLLLAILARFERWYRAWRQAGGDPDRSGLRAEYTRLSATIGRPVRAELPGGQALSGPAVGVDSDGRLLVRVSPGSEVPVAAADVVHLR